MKDVLSAENRGVLEKFARSNVLLAFDYDGTLAPIVPDRGRAAMRETTRLLLEELARLYPCIVVSGRAHHDAMARVRGAGVHEVVGNHGLEPWHATAKLEAEVGGWRRFLEERLAGLHGVEIEDKVYSLAIHYRRAPQKERARAAIMEAASALDRVRIIGGKQVVNLLPEGAPHKGIAVERERARLECDTAIYVGDDETDEDVFALDDPGRLLTIRVGRGRSLAAYFIGGQTRIDELLEALLALRQHSRIALPPWRGR